MFLRERIDLNSQICYFYKSQDYFDEIHKVYYGSASKNNDGFVGNSPVQVIDYTSQIGASKIKKILNETNYMKIKLDENCIVGWAERYYREYPHADKGDFLDDREGLIKPQKLENQKFLKILLFRIYENPPYSDDAASTPQTGKSRSVTKNTYVSGEFNKEVKSDIPGLIQSKDIANLFIWSGFKYYLRQKTDSYILFSPIKYWKIGHF